jgi:hypothetical protein
MSHDLLQVILEHFLTLKEEMEVISIAPLIYKLILLALPQDTMDIVLPIL